VVEHAFVQNRRIQWVGADQETCEVVTDDGRRGEAAQHWRCFAQTLVAGIVSNA
jgi:hypothetical protein